MKPSKRLAFCGILTAISIVLMFMTTLVPIANYTIPAICGALLIVAVVEMSRKRAMLIYMAVGLLSIFLMPNKESALIYIILFGYYPILKSFLEQKFKRPLQWFFKGVVFVIAIALITLASGLVSGFEVMKSYPIWLYFVGAVFVLVTFLCYDYCLSLLVEAYINKVRKKYIGKFLK